MFNAAVVSCWTELYDKYRDDLIRSLETVFRSPTIPPEILQTLLNLAEFMEHNHKPLPIKYSLMSHLAEKCHAFAKALHCKPEAAVGILQFAQEHHRVELRESWYEKLQRWDDALEAYERKQLSDRSSLDYTLGRMRCLASLGEWDRLSHIANTLWKRNSEDIAVKKHIAPLDA